MDELTENLQKLNMIKAKFDQNKEVNQIYSQPGNIGTKGHEKKAPGNDFFVMKNISYLKILEFCSCSTKASKGKQKQAQCIFYKCLIKIFLE